MTPLPVPRPHRTTPPFFAASLHSALGTRPSSRTFLKTNVSTRLVEAGASHDGASDRPRGINPRATVAYPPSRTMIAASPTFSRVLTRPSESTVARSAEFDVS